MIVIEEWAELQLLSRFGVAFKRFVLTDESYKY
jgi:hypothetical protein